MLSRNVSISIPARIRTTGICVLCLHSICHQSLALHRHTDIFVCTLFVISRLHCIVVQTQSCELTWTWMLFLQGVDVYLKSDGSGAGRGGEAQKDVMPPLMPGLKARQNKQ